LSFYSLVFFLPSDEYFYFLAAASKASLSVAPAVPDFDLSVPVGFSPVFEPALPVFEPAAPVLDPVFEPAAPVLDPVFEPAAPVLDPVFEPAAPVLESAAVFS